MGWIEPTEFKDYTNGCFTAHVNHGSRVAEVTNTYDNRIRVVWNMTVLTAFDCIHYLNSTLPGKWRIK